MILIFRIRFPRLLRPAVVRWGLSGRAWLALAAMLGGGWFGGSAPAHAADGTWSLTTANGTWVTAGNWVGSTIAGSTTATGNLGTAWFSADLTAGRTVTVDANRSIRDILFDSSGTAGGYTLSGGSLLLTSGGTIANAAGVGASNSINTPLTIVGNNSTFTITNSSTTSRTLTIGSSVTGQSTAGGTTTLILGGDNDGSNTFNLAALSNGTAGGVLALVKDGPSTWRTSVPGDRFLVGWNGPISINGGRLVVPTANGASQYFGGNSVSFANVAGAGLDFGSANYNRLVLLGSLAGGGAAGGDLLNANFANNGIVLGFDNADVSFGGKFGGLPSLRKVGTGIQTLTGSAVDPGPVTVAGGGLRLDFSQALTGTNILASNRSVTLGGGRLLLTGSASGVNSQTVAGVTVANGNNAVALTSDDATGLVLSLGAITRSAGGTLDVTLPDGDPSTTNGVRTSTTNQTNGVLTSANTTGIAYATVSGTTWAAVSGGNIVGLGSYATGVGSYTSSNNVDVTDDTVSDVTVNTLRFNGSHTLNLSGANTVNTGGVLVTAAATTGATIAGGSLRPGDNANQRELVVINNGGPLTIGSVIANTSGNNAAALTLSGTGLIRLDGLNTYTGATRIHSGTVRAGSTQALGVGSAVTISDNPRATLDLNGFDLTLGSLTGAADAAVTVTTAGGAVLLGGNTLTVGGNNASTTLASRISGSGALVKEGTGTLTLTGNNSISGQIAIRSGGLTVTNPRNTNPLGTATVLLGSTSGASDATLSVSSRNVSGVNLALEPGSSGNRFLNVEDATFNGLVGGTGDLIIRNPSNFNFATVSGTINNAGTLTLTNPGSGRRLTVSSMIGSNVTNVTLDNGFAGNDPNLIYMRATGNLFNTGTLSITGTAGDAAAATTVSGTITSIQALVVDSTPEVRLEGAANTFTAPVSIDRGTLRISNAQSLGINSPVTLADAGTARLSVFRADLALGSLAGGGASGGNVTFLEVDQARITTGGDNTSTTFAGRASGAGGFTKVGTGTFTLSGSSTNTGTNFVNEGTLRLTGAGAISGARMNVAGSGVLDLAVDTTTTGTVTMSGSAATILGSGSLTAPAYAITNTSGISKAAVALTGTGGLTKSGNGIALLSAANTYSGTTSITGGVLSITSTAALPGWDTAGRYTTSAGAALVVGNAVSDAEFNTIRTTGSFAANALIGFDTSAGDRTYASTPLANIGTGTIGLMMIGSGTLTMNAANTYTGTTSVRGGTLRLETALALPGTSPIWLQDSGSLEVRENSTTTGAVTMSGPASSIVGPGSLTAASYTVNNTSGTASATTVLAGAGGLTKSGAGTLSLTAANAYRGATNVQAGTLEFASIADSGTANFSALGSPTTGNSTIQLGSGTNAVTLRYVGSGHTSNRALNLAGSTGPVSFDASGSGGLELTGGNTAAGGTKTFTLTGTSTAANSIGLIAGSDVSVAKTGAGLWRLTGANSFGGRFTVSDGTIVAAVGAGMSGPGVFGQVNAEALLPLIGDPTDGATGQAAVLLESGVTISRGLIIPALGNDATQEVILGMASTSGTSGFDINSSTISLGRGVTLQAADGGTIVFRNQWVGVSGTGGPPPAVAFNVGSAGNAGTVVFGSFIPDEITAVNVRQGTLRLDAGNQTIGFATPVTLGEAGFGGRLDVNGITQPLSSLSFTGLGSEVFGAGTLRLFNSGGPAALTVAGTGHTIETALALDDAATVTVETGGWLRILSGIATGTNGMKTFSKAGPGILELSGMNSYSGPTSVSEGGLLVNGTSSGTGLVSVAATGWIGGRGSLAGGLTLLEDARLAFDPAGALNVTGSVVLPDSFSVASLVAPNGLGINWSDVAAGTYTLLATSSTFSDIQIQNFGPGNAAVLSDGRSAYFQNGSLQLVIVPEPGTLALAGLGLAAAAWAIRRATGSSRA